MAGEKFVDADRLFAELAQIPPPYFYINYSDQPMEKALKEAIQAQLLNYHHSLIASLTSAVGKASTASPCMLCKAPTDPSLPPNVYQG